MIDLTNNRYSSKYTNEKNLFYIEGDELRHSSLHGLKLPKDEFKSKPEAQKAIDRVLSSLKNDLRRIGREVDGAERGKQYQELTKEYDDVDSDIDRAKDWSIEIVL